jgi:hypothetical protein
MPLVMFYMTFSHDELKGYLTMLSFDTYHNAMWYGMYIYMIIQSCKYSCDINTIWLQNIFSVINLLHVHLKVFMLILYYSMFNSHQNMGQNKISCPLKWHFNDMQPQLNGSLNCVIMWATSTMHVLVDVNSTCALNI